jgi:hypothetical protein
MSLLCTIPLLCILVAALCLLLHTRITLNITQSLLCSAFLSSLCIFCILYSQCFCMLSPCQMIFLIIITTLHLLQQLIPCVHHHQVLCQDCLASPAVKTLRLLCHSRAHSLCCSSRIQRSYICTSPFFLNMICIMGHISLIDLVMSV